MVRPADAALEGERPGRPWIVLLEDKRPQMQAEHQGLVNGENNWVSLAFLGRERQNV